MALFLLVLIIFCGHVGPLGAQQSTDSIPPWAYRGKMPPLPALVRPSVLTAPWFMSWPMAPRPQASIGPWFRASADSLSKNRLMKRLGYLDEKAGAPAEFRGAFGLSPSTAEVHLDGEVRIDVSTSRQLALHCTPLLLLSVGSGCRATFTAPVVENEVVLRSSSIFGRRLHFDADYNTGRSYSTNNVIKLSYQGLEDEVVQRIDAGSVIFRPPSSRYLTASIPSNNFGLSGEFQIGPVAMQAILAKQKGSSAIDRQMSIGDVTTQTQNRKVADLDFEGGRFFWVVDPRTLPGYPGVDILSLDNVIVPDDKRPSEIQVYRYIAANQPGTAGATYDGITAYGTNFEGTTPDVTGAVRWKPLQPGIDFWSDPSGLWLVLALPLDQNDYLAVSYRTRTGAQVGTMPVIDRPQQSDSVHLIHMPTRGPAYGTFLHGMRQVYRVGGDLVRSSLKVAIQVAQSERPASGIGTYLSLLGMALPTDPALLDVDNRLFPRTRDPGANQVVKDQLLIFPNTQPFADADRLSLAERNDSLYRTPAYLLTSQGPPAKFQLVLSYDALSSGDSRGFFLGEVRPESEQITANGRRLVKGIDYSINYESGQVSFLKPAEIVPPGGHGTTIQVHYEQQALFAVAPTSITGLTATWGLGHAGGISIVGLYQSEQSAYRRPPVGSEPKASFLGGVTSNLNFELPALTRFISKISNHSVGAPSAFSFAAEMAFSRPDPNKLGEAYLEEFENDGGSPVFLSESAWLPGSSPQRPDGLEALGFAGGFQLNNAVQLTWQNLVQSGSSFLELTSQSIDTTIKVTDSRNPTLETVLWTTLHADTAGGQVDDQRKSHWTQPHTPSQPRWRSMTTSLSSTGVDLTQNEYLEFWLYQSGDKAIEQTGMRIVFDIGKVSEDAVAFAPTHFTVNGTDTTWTGRQTVGLGRMDTERTPLGTWNAVTDNNGILGDRPDSVIGPGGEVVYKPIMCRAKQSSGVVAYPLGDLGARCTNSNGVLNTEDLDGDGILDALGSSDDVQRYIVDIRDSAKYFVRDHAVEDNAGRVAKWTLYRVPLRNPDALIGQPDLRLTRHMRMTFITPPGAGGIDQTVRFGFAMMRLTGAPWIRRTASPILGLSGTIAESHGSVLVGSISTQNTELGYTSPPGLGNTQNEINGGIAETSVQINERALRLTVRDLRAGERAEAYHRLPGSSQNLLAYKELRVWLRGSGFGWADHSLEGYIKVGSDANNFYLYHVPVSTTTWEPDVVVELEKWRTLRALIETRFQNGEPPSGASTCGGDPTAWVACDGPYFVQVREPQINPPNLYSVQELATGIWRPGTGAPIAETDLWIDDIRLSAPVSETGRAGAVSMHLLASDVATFDFDYSYKDGQYRQLGESPSYRTNHASRVTGSMQLQRLLPTFGFDIPIFYSRDLSGSDLQLISGSDIRGSALPGLRRPSADAANWSISLRRRQGYSTSTLARLLIDPLQFNASGGSAVQVSELSHLESNQLNIGLNYYRSVSRHGFSLGLGHLTGGLPRWLRESEAGRGVGGATLAWLPNTIRFSSNISRSAGDYLSFKEPIERASDSILKPNTSLQHIWSNGAGFTWQPLGMLVATADWRSTRDLREYPDSTSLGRVVARSRQSLFGQDVGVERDRSLLSTVVLSPRLNSWLRPQLSTVSNFFLSRSLTSRNPVRILGDTAGGYILPQTLNNTRSTRVSLDFDPLVFARRAWGDSSGISKALNRLRPLSISRTHTSQSTFDLAAFTPGASYELALGGLGDFLQRGNDRAVGAGEMWSTDFSADLDLPGGVTVTTRYISSASDRYQRLLGSGFLKTNTTQVEWPSGDFLWAAPIRAGVITRVSLGSSIRRQVQDSRTPITGGQVSQSSTTTELFRPNGSLSFRNGVTLTGSTSRTRDVVVASGSTTRHSTDVVDVSMGASIRLPRSISKMRRSLTTDVALQIRSDRTCLERLADSGCATYSDQGLIDVRGSLFATLGNNGIRAGGQFGWGLDDNRSLKRQVSRINLRVYVIIPLTQMGF